MYIQQGEVREIGIEIINTQSPDFIIELADYNITRNDGSLFDSGHASITNHKLIILFSALEIGRFNVHYVYRIGPEILKADICLEVH